MTSTNLADRPRGQTQKSALSSTWFSREDVTLAGRTWYLEAYDRAVGKKGQIEYLQLQVTVHTLPNRAVTDADGLNDSEEMNLGSDGFATDPWKTDTDGDTLADNEYSTKGTSPVLADTDRDGYADNVDRFPLADAFVQVHVTTTKASGSDDDATPSQLEPFVAVTYDGERSFTQAATWRLIGGESVGLINHYYSFNIPDDAVSIQLKVEAWDYDADNSHEPINVASSNSTTLTYDTGPYVGWFQNFLLSGKKKPKVVNLNFTVTTVTPIRTSTFLLVPADYSGIYNVTAGSSTVSRRYVGEPKFYAVIVNLTDAGYGYDGEKQTWLVPRSVFFETYLSTRLNNEANMTGWLGDAANDVRFTQNASDGPGTAALDGTLTADLDVAEWTTMIDWLERNVSGNVTHRHLRVDWEPSIGDYFFLLGLPDAIVQIASYEPLPNSPSQAYVFDYRPVWQRIWDGTVGAALTWIASGFVAAANFFANLPAMLAQLGAWLWTNIVGPWIAVVESAVRAAGKVLDQFVTAFLNAIKIAFELALKPLIDAISDFANKVMDSLARAMLYGREVWSGRVDALPGVIGAILELVGLLGPVFLYVGLAMSVVAFTITILSGPIGFAVGLISGLISDTIMNLLGGALVGTGNPIGQILGWLLQGDFLDVLDQIQYSIVGVSVLDVPPNGQPSNLESAAATFALAMTIMATVVAILGAGGLRLYELWHNALWSKGGIVGVDRSDVLHRSEAAGIGLASLIVATGFALLALSPKPRDQRIAAGAASIVAGFLAIIAVHSSYPHNRAPNGSLLTTRILPPWVRAATDILGVLAIVSSAGAIVAASAEK